MEEGSLTVAGGATTAWVLPLSHMPDPATGTPDHNLHQLAALGTRAQDPLAGAPCTPKPLAKCSELASLEEQGTDPVGQS